MNTFLGILVCGLGCLSVVSLGEADKNSSNDIIQVQVTGMLSGPPLSAGDAKETIAGAVFASGRESLLDCAGNKAAKEMLRKAYADQSKFTGYIPSKKVQVKGRLHFQHYLLYDAKGKQIEHRDSLPVIVVESLKFVE